jgi:hypothetical protein
MKGIAILIGAGIGYYVAGEFFCVPSSSSTAGPGNPTPCGTLGNQIGSTPLTGVTSIGIVIGGALGYILGGGL